MSTTDIVMVMTPFFLVWIVMLVGFAIGYSIDVVHPE